MTTPPPDPSDLPPLLAPSQTQQPEQSVEAELAELVADPGRPDRPQILREIYIKIFGGPIPPPEMLRDYDANLPGTGNRIVTNWETEAVHRRQMVRDEAEHRWKLEDDRADIARLVAEGDTRRADRGQWAAIGLHVLMIGGGVVLLVLNKNIAGYATLCGAIGSGVVQLLLGKRNPPAGPTTGNDKPAKT